jgi:hypothetical protein
MEMASDRELYLKPKFSVMAYLSATFGPNY